MGTDQRFPFTFNILYQRIKNYLEQSVSIAPLVTLRIAFGLIMLISTVRYMLMGWVETQLIDPVVHFSYYGFEWIRPLPGLGLYIIFVILIIACLAIMLGWYYRLFSILFFILFSYIELIDLTYYLNHYYFVSIVSFLLILVPANRYFSLDVRRKPAIYSESVSLWCIGIFKLQIAIVYCFAGLAKINYDWLIKALPLSIWLPAKTSMPIIGPVFAYKSTAYLFSWAGMLFDTFIIFFLIWKKTRWLAYGAVVIFHVLTGLLFQIGIFPLVMIFAVTIFFSPSFHERLLTTISNTIQKLFGITTLSEVKPTSPQREGAYTNNFILIFLTAFFLFQLLFPWRYLLYPGNVFWTEEGYRFAWRVMLMEKAGTATFYVKDGPNGREGSVINHQFLNAHQEKQMAMQPDMVLQFAHFLEAHFRSAGMEDPHIRAEVWVTLNARPARLLIDPTVDLTEIKDTWKPKEWIMPFEEEEKK